MGGLLYFCVAALSPSQMEQPWDGDLTRVPLAVRTTSDTDCGSHLGVGESQAVGATSGGGVRWFVPLGGAIWRKEGQLPLDRFNAAIDSV